MTFARTALVIGNSDYAAAPLSNPVNDATDIANKLRELDFDVTIITNASRRQMRRGIRDYSEALRTNGGVGLFYYAGHGMQIKGVNYLIPTDAEMRDEFEIPDETVSANSVLRALEDAGNDLNIVVLDACRDNPFAKSYRSTAESGLARMDAPGGSIIAYATAPGDVALDGNGRNGLYTKHLLTNMDKPGMPIEQMFKKVRIGVLVESGDQQTPWEESSLRSDFYFAPTKVYEVVIPDDGGKTGNALTSVPVAENPVKTIGPVKIGTVDSEKEVVASPSVPESAKPVKKTREQLADELLAKAARALDDYRLTTPEGDNALYYYREVLKVDPVNLDGHDGLQMITQRYITLAARELDSENPNKAQTFITRGLSIQPENYQLHKLQSQTEELKVQQASVAATPDPVPQPELLTEPAPEPEFASDPEAVPAAISDEFAAVKPAPSVGSTTVTADEETPESPEATTEVAEVQRSNTKTQGIKEDFKEDVGVFKKSIKDIGKSIKSGLFSGIFKKKNSGDKADK